MFETSRCLVCQAGSPESFAALREQGVPHGEKGHNVMHGYACVSLCRACGHGQVETHSHDCWSHDEPWDMYWWFVLEPAEVARLREVLGPCPARMNPGCACPAHEGLRHSSDRLYGGVRSAESPGEASGFARVRVETGEVPRLVLVK
jgi:hypothetical protein